MIKELNYTEDYGKKLAKKRDKTGFPRGVIFEITHQCNLRCRHCYIAPESDKKELSTQEVRSVFDQLVEAGCLHATLTGGEPLMRKDIITLIDYARRIGLFIRLFTNATLITPPIADKLKEFQLISVEISLHSLKRERFDWFTQVAGSYDRTMKAINFLKERMIKIALKITITRANLDEIGELKEFVEYLGAAPEWATLLMPRHDGSKDNITLRLEPESVVNFGAMLFSDPTRDVDRSVEEIPKSDNNPGKRWIRGRLFQCGAGKRGLAISPYGELKPCLELPATGYSVLNGGLKEGWKMLGDYVRSFKPNPDNKCFDCRLRKFCSSCPAKARLECGDMNACPPYYRRLAELSRDKKTMDERRWTK
jgi:radical SAM protein with 4Fe4S-binding SPASM domain